MTGNSWREMFDQRGNGAGQPVAERPPAMEPVLIDEDGMALDVTEYKPWIIQRGRSRPAMMLEFRRYEPRSGLWSGWAISYPHLIALEYTSDKMLSLDFGMQHVTLRGQGLDKLARFIQQGAVLTIQEYADQIWPQSTSSLSIDIVQRFEFTKSMS